MGIEQLWDTNTAIYYLQQQFPKEAEAFIDQSLQDNQPAISVITEMELLCWPTATDKDLEVLHDFIKHAYVFDLEQAIKYKTVELRKVHKIKLPDAIIAATALVNDLTFITRNSKDFKNISNLKLINPFDL